MSYDAISVLSGERALVKRDGIVRMIDLVTGNTVIAPKAGDMCAFGDKVIVEADGKRAIHDMHTGIQLIPPRFERISLNFDSGLQQVLLQEKWGFADLEGTLVSPATSEAQPFFDRGIAWMKTGSTWCPIDRRGKPIPSMACNADYQSKLAHWKPHVCLVGQ